ncbi:hypothetical protein [Leyella stercorea]|nr:hypothetical protein [Leyella stercorea]
MSMLKADRYASESYICQPIYQTSTIHLSFYPLSNLLRRSH